MPAVHLGTQRLKEFCFAFEFIFHKVDFSNVTAESAGTLLVVPSSFTQGNFDVKQ